MNEDVAQIMQLCVCSHAQYTHGYREPNKDGKRLRGACTHGEAGKICGCRKYVEVAS